MDEGEVAEARCVFRGIEHILRIRNTDDHLEVEVEDALTTDQWRGEFDAECECLSCSNNTFAFAHSVRFFIFFTRILFCFFLIVLV